MRFFLPPKTKRQQTLSLISQKIFSVSQDHVFCFIFKDKRKNWKS